MTSKDYKGGKIIILSKPFDSRSKVLNLFYFILFFTAAAIFLRILLVDDPNLGAAIAATIGIIVFFIAAYRFANKAVLTEKIFVAENNIEIIKQGLFKITKQQFEKSKISDFRHLAKTPITKHPLAGETFDYLGFQTEQQVINEMYGENRLAFDYDGKTIRFGDNIYSWDFEEIKIVIFS